MQNLYGPKISDAIAIVAGEFDVTHSVLVGERGPPQVSFARHVAMWLARATVPGASFEKIGRQFGNRDHSTVLFGCRRIATLRASDATLAQATDRLAEQINARAALRASPDMAAWRSLGGELRAS